MTTVNEAIIHRRLAFPGVAAALDLLSTSEVVGMLGPSDREVRRYAVPAPIRLSKDDPFEPVWKVGDGRPALATDDPAEVAAMNLCAIARSAPLVRTVGVTGRHPVRCGWCDYPLLELHRAIAHATYFARLVLDHLLVWVGDDGGIYLRPGNEHGRYQNQRWQDFAELHAGEQRRRVELVLGAVREGAA